MALPSSQKIDTNLGTILKASTVAVGLGTFLGCVIFAFYCLRLDYLPSGVSAGESLIFIILAACFGFLYSIIVACLLSVGVCIGYLILNPLLRVLEFIYDKFTLSRSPHSPPNLFRFVKPSPIHFILLIFGIGLVLGFSNQNWKLLFQLSSTILMISVAWTYYQNNELKRFALFNEPETRENCHKIKKLTQLKYLLLGFIFIVPMLFGGIALKTLEGGMRLSSLQKRDTYILVQPPYSRFIPEDYQVKDPKYIEPGYTTFQGIDVKLTNIGQKTIIQFLSEKEKLPQPFEIPNDKIIIVPAPK